MAPVLPAHYNLEVDYVISYRVPPNKKTEAITQFRQLIRALAEVGLETEVRNGDGTSLLVFVKAADEKVFGDVVYRSRIRDWLHGVRQIQPDSDRQKALQDEPLTDAERFRMVYHMITSSRPEGGADVQAKAKGWDYVEAIFPLHDLEKNKRWLEDISRKTFLTPTDLDYVRNNVGEKIAYYYAFMQSYFMFMMFPAAFGFACWVLLGHYSGVYAIVNTLWCAVFVEWWKRQETDLAIRWGVKNVSSIEEKRKDFRAEKTMTDPITGEKVAYFSSTTRLLRQCLQVPFVMVSASVLGAVIVVDYAIEVFISEVYTGPFKWILAYAPTIVMSLAVPTISTYLTDFARQLTEYENYETKDAYDKAMVSKVFVINFITSYLAIFLTSFVYVPFAAVIVPYLDVFKLTVRPFAENEKQMTAPHSASFVINPNRLRGQMIYFAVTAQVVNFVLETVVPFVQQRGMTKYKAVMAERAEKKGGAVPGSSMNDHPEEKDFLARVREEATRLEYDVTTDLREMVIQFGYLSLFSVIWPLTPVTYFINNWVEIRGDTIKLTMESKRPVPQRADSIGSWIESLQFLAWLGSVTSAALVYMFSNDGLGPDGRPEKIKLWGLLLTIILSEHIYLVVRMFVRLVISKLDSENVQKERSERFMIRKKYLEDAGLADAIRPITSAPMSPLKDEHGDTMGTFTRESLEEAARASSLHDSTPETRFWSRQQGWQESEKVGLGMIDLMEGGEETKKQQ